jgi:hypothetical protein
MLMPFIILLVFEDVTFLSKFCNRSLKKSKILQNKSNINIIFFLDLDCEVDEGEREEEYSKTGPNPLFCVVCQMIFTGKWDFSRHLKSASHLRREEEFSETGNIPVLGTYCVVCQQNFDYNSNLRRHVKTDSHLQREKMYPKTGKVPLSLEKKVESKSDQLKMKVTRHYCIPCQRYCRDITDLRRHCQTQTHLKKEEEFSFETEE